MRRRKKGGPCPIIACKSAGCHWRGRAPAKRAVCPSCSRPLRPRRLEFSR